MIKAEQPEYFNFEIHKEGTCICTDDKVLAGIIVDYYNSDEDEDLDD